jgi:hypothetical protein
MFVVISNTEDIRPLSSRINISLIFYKHLMPPASLYSENYNLKLFLLTIL